MANGVVARMAAMAGLTVGVLALPMIAWAQPRDGGGGRQWGGGGGGGGMRSMMMVPPITKRQMDAYAETLALEPEQREAAETLFEGYQQQARDGQQTMREAMEKMREGGGPGGFETMRTSMTTYRAERKKLDGQFASDLREILAPEQGEKWPAVERAWRRDQTLRRGFLSGERVDLLELSRDAEIDAAGGTVKALLEEYELELDRELAKRNAVYDEQIGAMGQFRGPEDFAKMEEGMAKGREAGVRVREVNRKYARQVVDALPEEKRAEFEKAFRRASFPAVYGETETGKALAAAEGFADLTEEQKAEVARIRATHERALDGVNERLASAVEESEMNATMQSMFRGRGGEGPLADMRRERRELERGALESLKKTLSADQVVRLPKAEQGERRRQQVDPDEGL